MRAPTLVFTLALFVLSTTASRRTCRAPQKPAAAAVESGPCKGSCSFEAQKPSKNHKGAAKLRISGNSHSVSDITPEAGWTILSCNATALAQEVRIVCHSPDCAHLFEGHGAVDTVVRLPEECGASPFARIAAMKRDADQTVPADVDLDAKAAAYHAHASDGPGSGNLTHTVFLASIDTDFAAVNATRTGPIEFSIEGYNFNASDLTPTASLSHIERREIQRRGWFNFNKTRTIDLPPLKIARSFPLLSASLECIDYSVSASAGLSADIDTTVSVGFIAAGTVIPPKITEFATFTGLNGKIGGRLEVDLAARGTVATGKIPFWSTHQ
ncbi:USP domain-containing protein [Mycena indigotica]|uniref:USP domain-containing protein n=1 Tax=Mycena indigotica TaxID=2126181 RepID=A0A8H6VV62_9AGAR|nr:USP domain-containing protein [Mycena indigotica]KAF7291288.1 USP domain-containing protein [Mycena indigotica]